MLAPTPKNKEAVAYPKRVWLATAHDEEAVMVLCRELHAENGMFPLNEEKVRRHLRKAFNKEGGILGVIGEPGKLESMIYMTISTFWYSDQAHLEELFLYVRPEYRKSRNALELMQFARWCSLNTGFPLIIGVISEKQTVGKVRLYRRNLGRPVGAFFLYNSDHPINEAALDYSELQSKLRSGAKTCSANKPLSGEERSSLSGILKEASDAIDAVDELWGCKN
jgi:hypothetical protein